MKKFKQIDFKLNNDLDGLLLSAYIIFSYEVYSMVHLAL